MWILAEKESRCILIMEKTFNDYVSIYKKQVQKGDIRIAYERLVKYMSTLKADFAKNYMDFSCSNVLRGYMDYTYFYFSNEYLKEHKLKFGVVLNHEKIQFELWLMGINVVAQKQYWDLLKDSKWNKHIDTMPKYSDLELVLVDCPDFNDLKNLTSKINLVAYKSANEILEYVKSIS